MTNPVTNVGSAQKEALTFLNNFLPAVLKLANSVDISNDDIVVTLRKKSSAGSVRLLQEYEAPQKLGVTIASAANIPDSLIPTGASITMMTMGDVFTNSVSGAEKLISPFTEIQLKDSAGAQMSFGSTKVTLTLGFYIGVNVNATSKLSLVQLSDDNKLSTIQTTIIKAEDYLSASVGIPNVGKFAIKDEDANLIIIKPTPPPPPDE